MYRLKQFTLFTGDLICLYAGLYAGTFLRYLHPADNQFLELLSPMTALFLLAATIMFISGLYDANKTKNTWLFFQKIPLSAAVWMLAGIAYFYVNPEQNIAPKTILLLTTITGFGLIAIWRFIYNKFITIKLTYKVLFAGLTDDVKELIEQIKKEPQLGYQIAGILLYEKDSSYTQSAAYAQSHNISVYTSTSLRDNLSQINIVVLSPVMAANTSLLQTLYQSLFQGISIVELSDFYESVMHRIPPFTFSEGWFIAHLQEQQKKIYDRIRILSDYFLGACLGLLCTATLPFIALAIKLNSKGKIFFTQNRVGRGGAIFKVYKFRTMKSLSTDGSAETNGPQYAATADMRITSVGKFLRLTRLDETPQFINILKGEMSFIGPRPERPEFVAQLTEKMPFYSLRHLIKPGLTGWAQVQKSYYGTIEENLQKLEYDLFYIKNRNFTLDVSILLRTISTILRMAGR
jgi:exopolysaccharide biosynthesis polyprenyl glycosylphosphotransferase